MNEVEAFQYGLSNGYHKKEGWFWRRLVAEGLVADTASAKRERCYHAYHSQKVFIMAQKQIMPAGWDPI